jgi:hypothetical protein
VVILVSPLGERRLRWEVHKRVPYSALVLEQLDSGAVVKVADETSSSRRQASTDDRVLPAIDAGAESAEQVNIGTGIPERTVWAAVKRLRRARILTPKGTLERVSERVPSVQGLHSALTLHSACTLITDKLHSGCGAVDAPPGFRFEALIHWEDEWRARVTNADGDYFEGVGDMPETAMAAIGEIGQAETRHRQVRTTHPLTKQRIGVDAGLVTLLRLIWRIGLATDLSCEGGDDRWAWIMFPLPDALAFVEASAGLSPRRAEYWYQPLGGGGKAEGLEIRRDPPPGVADDHQIPGPRH